MIEPVSPERRLRICVVGDLDGPHTQGWIGYFVARGHDMHAISYYPPARPPEGVQVHVLRPPTGRGGSPTSRRARPRSSTRLAGVLPPGVQRLTNLIRYRRAGLRKTVESIAPDVLHAHYLVEHGLYATSANFRPYVVSAWGSDVLVEPERSRLNRAIARFVIGRATLATANNRHMLREMVLNLGAERGRTQHIVLGVSQRFLDFPGESINARANDRAPVVLSTRSLDTPLYNVDVIVRAMARVRERIPNARLVVAGDGRLKGQLEALAKSLALDATFLGFVSQEDLHRALLGAEVFVSVPSSDATSVALLQAMATGSFPIVSDLPSQQELVEDGTQGLRVPARDEAALASAIVRALEDRELRRSTIERNRRFVEEYGVLETNMARMEAWYYRLAGRTDEVHS